MQVEVDDDDDDEVLFISRFRLRPYAGTRRGRPGEYLSNYLHVLAGIIVKQLRYNKGRNVYACEVYEVGGGGGGITALRPRFNKIHSHSRVSHRRLSMPSGWALLPR